MWQQDDGDLTSPRAKSSVDEEDTVPTDHPMRWPWSLRHLILAQLALSAFSGGFTSAILIPATDPIAEALSVSVQTAVYVNIVHVLFLGIGPFIWAPLMKLYGKRPVLIGSFLLSCLSALGGGYANSYGGLVTARIFQSMGVSSGFVVPGAIVVELFPKEQRGRKNGVWASPILAGPAVGGIIGGPLAANCGWRWCLWLVAIMSGVQTLVYALTCPETSYAHRQNMHLSTRTASELWRLPRRLPGPSANLFWFCRRRMLCSLRLLMAQRLQS